jgi:hypothetical protein
VTGGATFAKGVDGLYQPIVTLVDDRGCHREAELPETMIGSEATSGTLRANFAYTIDVRRPVATADLRIEYQYLDGDQLARKQVFSDQRTLDDTIRPPFMPTVSCSTQNSKMGNARTMPGQHREAVTSHSDQTDARAIAGMSRNETVATAINTAGFLCARVTDLYPDSGGQMIVHCIQYRSGRGRVKYRIDPDAGSVEQLQ